MPRPTIVQIGRYLKDHQPALAQSTVHTLYEAAESLTQFPHRGRVGQEANTRELVVAPLPYVIVYRVAGAGATGASAPLIVSGRLALSMGGGCYVRLGIACNLMWTPRPASSPSTDFVKLA